VERGCDWGNIEVRSVSGVARGGDTGHLPHQQAAVGEETLYVCICLQLELYGAENIPGSRLSNLLINCSLWSKQPKHALARMPVP
jgi:hypothetical protein